MSATTFQQFRNKLDELFQMDRAELDFGIYRIMNVKRAEVSRYLESDLEPQVDAILANAVSGDVRTTQEELATLEAQLRDAGVDPASSPKVQDLRARLSTASSPEELRQRAFSYLLTFFSRYYDKGDFVSKRRYKDGTYMIPYNGEEVKLVWANMDQYYIKTSEYLRDYRFFLNAEKSLRMCFKLVEGDTERDNIKGKNRVFTLAAEEPVTLVDDGLVARFEYVLSDTKQKDASTNAAKAILEHAGKFRVYLEQKDEKSGKSLIEKHLSAYTARNSEDYFIHKDLKGFLERELDFFLKNEVLRIDDMLGEDGEGMQTQLHLARAIKEVGGKIIIMLAQIEEFQKKLWLKRKMVTSTNYLVTLDKIIEKAPELLPQIADSEAQREEWVRLFAIDEITSDDGELPGLNGVAYSEPLTEEFLRANDKLVVDTRFFDREFTAALLAGFDDIDAETDGLLVHSENFQALNLLRERYREKVKCIYIDPPYNTGQDGFLYVDKYKRSAWLQSIADRFLVARELINDRGVVYSSISDAEQHRLIEAVGTVMGERNLLQTIVWRKRSTPPNDKVIGAQHEYITGYAKCAATVELNLKKRSEEQLSRYSNPDHHPKGPWTSGDLMANVKGGRYVPSLNFEIVNPRTGQRHSPGKHGNWRFNRSTIETLISDNEIWFGRDDKGRPKLKRFLADVKEGISYSSIWDFVPLNTQGSSEFASFFADSSLFESPKPVGLLAEMCRLCATRFDTILDFFAGSGTTGHAVINLNREDSGSRKYILVEMGEYFDTVLKPRIAKVVYSAGWKDGKPQSRDTGVSHLVKYIRLESYEDTLNNLTVPEQGEYSSLLEQGVEREFREGYLLNYMLDWEAGAARVTTEQFAKPFDAILHVAGDTVGERRPVTVDLVETFNYLIGLTVKSYYEVEGCRIVEGHDAAGDHVLVVWRDLDTTDNAALNELFLKQRINVRDREFDLIYVNGDNNLENIRREDESWKVRLIEHEFTSRMFTEGGV